MKVNFNKALSYVKLGGSLIKKHKKGIIRTAKYALGIGAVVSAVKNAPRTVHELEDAGLEKGSELNFSEKAAIVVKTQVPAIVMATGSVGADIAGEIVNAKEVKEVTAENISLLGQIADIGNSYNMVNDIKNAMQKKVEEDSGPEAVKEVVKEASGPHTHDIIKQARSKDAYVADPRRIEEWNDIYLRSGNPDYKIQEYVLADCGQNILSCNYAFAYADKEMERRKSREYGRGYVTENDWLEMVGARTIDRGDYFIWRDSYEYFGTNIEAYNDDGVAVMLVRFAREPYYDSQNNYSTL